MRLHLVAWCRLMSLASVLLLAGCATETQVSPSPLPVGLGATTNVHSADAHGALELQFEKTGGNQPGPILTWTGTVTLQGQPFGALTTSTDATTWTPHGASGKAFRVRFDFVVTRDASVMVLDLEGLLNLPSESSGATGLVNMNGIVREASGAFASFAGARVHEQGRLVGISNGASHWAGVIRIAVGSAQP
jgi:hypothetical protein